MIREAVVAILLGIVTAGAWLISQQYTHPAVVNAYLTALILTICYVIFKLIIEQVVLRGVRSERTRYYIRKTSSFGFLLIALLAILAIWVPNPQALLVAYGLIAAGVAVAMQDFLKSLVGGLIILLRSPFHVGDRIQLGDRHGDVVDVGILYTTLYELREWVAGDQATGRICHVPNSALLTGTVHNYTEHSSFIWDELRIPITLDSDWEAANRIALKVAEAETKGFQKRAKRDFSKVKKEYYVHKREFTPQTYWTIEESNHRLALRYVTPARERRATQNKITTRLLKDFARSKKIDLGSVDVIQSV